MQTLESVSQLDEFTPSADAVAVGDGVEVPLELICEGGLPLEGYRGPSGKALLTIKNDRNGHAKVTDAKTVDGPAELLPAVVKAVSKMKFHPFMVLGSAVETTSKVEFSIVTHKQLTLIEAHSY